MAENKPLPLSLISAYGQGRMAETKPVRLSLISAHGKGKMAETKPVRLCAILPCPYAEIWDNHTGLV
jgi:Cys-tRNA synthase (O-phospho-L-seryl-tRNA:Cys-tRNA synthase)